MNLLDSSVWLEYLSEGPNASQYHEPFSDVSSILVPTICLYEVFKIVLRETDENKAIQSVALMKQGSVVDLTEDIAVMAAKFSSELKLPMADSVILSTARKYNAVIWTQDADFRNLTNVKFFPKR